MRIGILQCDDVRSSLSTEFGEYSMMIAEQLSAIDETFTFQTYETHEGQLPDEISECDAYIITGSRYTIFDSEALWINGLLDFIVCLNKANVRAVGIGFGYHAIASAMECKVERADTGWLIGVHAIEVQEQADFMQPSASRLHLAMLSEDQVQSITDHVSVLASSTKCPYTMLQFGENMLGVQGRPELSPTFAKRLLNLRQDEFPSKRFAKGIESFAENDVDNELIFTWFANFMRLGHCEETAEIAANDSGE